MLEPLCSLTGRRELGQPDSHTTASAELGSFCSHRHGDAVTKHTQLKEVLYNDIISTGFWTVWIEQEMMDNVLETEEKENRKREILHY